MRVELSGLKLVFPLQCSCCGNAASGTYAARATRTTGKRVVRSTSRGWEFPHCDVCAGHLRAYISGSGPAALSLLVGVVLGFAAHWGAVFVGVLAATLFVLKAHAQGEAARTPSCATASAPAAFVGWSGTVQRFEIASPAYASALMLANEKRLINLTHQGREALLAAAAFSMNSTPARATAAASRPALLEAELLRWVAKVEAQRGPAGRRAVLAEALCSTGDEASRQRLLLEASRIEVGAVLDKVDGLKTPAAKKRHLKAALDALKSDDVPDELQSQQVSWLEQALEQLEQPQ